MDNGVNMIPQKGDDRIYLPTTIEKKGGSFEIKSNRLLYFAIVTGVYVILFVLMAISKKHGIIGKSIYIAIYTAIYTTIVRYGVIKEKKYRRSILTLEEHDYEFNYSNFWNIYKVSSTYPYICYFKDGSIGVFVRMEKGSILGDEDEVADRHYNAITEAYRRLWSTKLSITHLDLMDNVGNDDRMEGLFASAAQTKYKNLGDVYTDIFENIQRGMRAVFTSTDYYRITTTENEEYLWKNAKDILETMLEGNYNSYKVLNYLNINELVRATMNIEEFSVVEACKQAKSNNSLSRNVTPISTVDIDGNTTILNKTMEEKRQEDLIKRKEREISKQKKTKLDESEINLDQE